MRVKDNSRGNCTVVGDSANSVLYISRKNCKYINKIKCVHNLGGYWLNL